MAVAGLEPAAALGAWDFQVASVEPMAGGHINASWRVITATGGSFLLQRLNPEVFPDGEAVMRNIANVTAHLSGMVRHLPAAARLALHLVPRPDGAAAWQGPDRAWWRVFRFIDGARTCFRVPTMGEAHEVGRAFGRFQQQMRSYSGPPLTETLPGFHDTAARVAALEWTIERDTAGRAATVRDEIAFARGRMKYTAVFPPLIANGALPVRVVHNDAKAANVLLDAGTGEALAVVDLDTVMPGTLLHDIGDLIRSLASPSDEDERDLTRILIQPDLLDAMARGFLAACGEGLAEAERRHFIFAGLLLTYEQGIRFLTDYLAGDRYYRVARPGQNLDRARAQFRLLERLESDRSALEAMVERVLAECPR